jgi:hypothetical protein
VDLLKGSTKSRITLHPFNITNSYQYLTGANAEVYELGSYSFDVTAHRTDLDLSKSADTVTYNLYNSMEFNSVNSCDSCDDDDIVTVQNMGYLTVFFSSHNEGFLLLGMTCSTTQIGLISSNPSSAPYCQAAELGTATVCVCCSPTPTSGAITCSSLMTTTSKAGGIISWLAKYDYGVQLNSAGSSFALSTGAYSPLLRSMKISELAFGHVSSVLGFFKAAAAVRSNDFPSLYQLANTTQDMVDACYALYCPSIASVTASIIGGAGISAARNVKCTGSVPSVDVLVSQGNLTQERAQQLRYLQGVQCGPLGPSIAIAGLLGLDAGATRICADGSVQGSTPCCLRSFSSTVLNVAGSGTGCLTFISGLIQPRRVYSNEEALTYLLPSIETQV